MRRPLDPSCSRRSLRSLALCLALSALAALPAAADPTLGFLETWPGTGLDGWGGGATLANPGTGGVGGVGDGFLLVSQTSLGNLGTKSSATAYLGNWPAANVNLVKLWLNDVNLANSLEIHFSIGQNTNLWQYNQGFVPPHNAWAQFSVDLSAPTGFTQIIGTSAVTFAQALAAVEVVLVRHDLAPYMQSPDPTVGDFGMDNLLLTNPLVGVEAPPPTVKQPVLLAPPFPNPSRGPVVLALESVAGEEIHIQIVDAAGRIVRQAVLAPGATASRLWTWDGRDDAGRLVPPGAYRARAVSRSGGTSRPLVRVP